MATPAIVQTIAAATASSVTSVSVTFGVSVTSGNALVGLIRQATSDTRSYSMSDDVNGSWAKEAQSSTGQKGYASYFLNAAAGTTEVTWTATASSTFRYTAYEISDADEADAGDVDGFNTVARASNATNHQFFPGSDTFSADSIVLAAGQHNASSGTLTPNDGQTHDDTDTNGIFAYKIYSSGATEDLDWTSVTSRHQYSAAVSLKASGAPPSGEPVSAFTPEIQFAIRNKRP